MKIFPALLLFIHLGFTAPFFSPFRFQGLELENYLDKILGYYGDHRNSYVEGHKHSGIDIEGKYKEKVYAISSGKVVDIFGEFPNKTIYILHFAEGKSFISSYIHVEGIKVEVGEMVDHQTELGRIFNTTELKSSGFNTKPHLHFEIRHNLIENELITYSCMSKEELNRYFINPLEFSWEKRSK